MTARSSPSTLPTSTPGAQPGTDDRHSGGVPLRPTRVALDPALGQSSAPIHPAGHPTGPAGFPTPARRRRKARALLASRGSTALGLQIARISRGPQGSATLVARFPGAMAAGLGPVLASLAVRALEVRRLESVAGELPASLGEALARTLRTASTVAAGLGAAGALAGVVLIDGEALVPHLGWIPAPVVGALLGAGLLGALGMLLGALAVILFPSLSAPRGPASGVVVVVRTRPFDLDAVVAGVVDAGGSIAAIGGE